MESIKSWEFDFVSSIITIVLVPLGIYILKLIYEFLKKWIGRLLEAFFYCLSGVLKHSLAATFSLKKYCQLQLEGQSKNLSIPSSLDIQLPLDEVFITLILEQRGKEQSQINHNNIFESSNRSLVMGDPGSGKSSLVKKLFREACKSAIQKPKKSQLPVLLELKELKIPDDIKDECLGEWLFNKISEDANKFKVFKMEECFKIYSETEGLLVLLDGLDEVSTSQYPKVRTAIKGLNDKLIQMGESNKILLTMRTQFYQQIKEDFISFFGSGLLLKPFSPSDIYNFLTRWPFKLDAEKKIAEIYKKLTDTPTLRELCTNPLILSMYVAEDQAAGSVETPESRTQFYNKVVEEFIISRRSKQIGPPKARTKLKEQRLIILGELAYQHLIDPQQPANSLNFSEALRIIKKVMHCDDSEAKKTFREISKETGLITEERLEESFRFIHLTFCEYLAAYHADQEYDDGWNKLLVSNNNLQEGFNPQNRSRLLETIPFSFGLLKRNKINNAIVELSKLNDNRLLARCFLETKAYDHTCWSDFVEEMKESLLSTPEKNWDENWLKDLHLFNVVLLDAKISAEHIPSSETPYDPGEFFKTLIEKQEESLFILLSTYSVQDAAAAFRLAELANLDLLTRFPKIIISNCDQAPFFALIKEQALKEKRDNRILAWASVFSESALQSSVVAHWMHQLEPNPLWENIEKQISPENKWFNSKIIKNSLYIQCLSISSKAILDKNYVFLSIIRNIPSPGFFKKMKTKPLYLFGIIGLSLMPFFTFITLHSNQIFVEGGANYVEKNYLAMNASFLLLYFYIISRLICRITLRKWFVVLLNITSSRNYPFRTPDHLFSTLFTRLPVRIFFNIANPINFLSGSSLANRIAFIINYSNFNIILLWKGCSEIFIARK